MPQVLPPSETSKIVLRCVFDHAGLTNVEEIAERLEGSDRQLSTDDISAALRDLGDRGLVIEMDGVLTPSPLATDNKEALLG